MASASKPEQHRGHGILISYDATPSPPPKYGRHGPAQHDSETTTLLVAPTRRGSWSCAWMAIMMVLAVVVMAIGAYIFRLQVYRELTLARKKLQNEQLEWEWEVKGWEARREEERSREEQWHREEEAREKLGLFWDEPKPEYNCLASGTREHWSLLRNVVPYNYNWLTPCMEIPAIIQGVSRTVDRCEIKMDGSGAVYGHWTVDDAKCTPYWDWFKDKGCTAPGSRTHRYEAHLAEIPDGEDWMKICSTTPYDFLGRHFDHPHSCMHWGKYGVYANWEIEDWDC